jgi:hypothetical protein
MNFVVIGTDHTVQQAEKGFEGLLRGLIEREFFEPLKAIAEEYADNIGTSICQRLAEERGLLWYNLDMSSEEKHAAGILVEQRSRPISQESVAFRLASDDVREDAWVKKLASSAPGTTLVVCGYLHFESLVQKLRAKCHIVDKRVYLETVPEIRALSTLDSANTPTAGREKRSELGKLLRR